MARDYGVSAGASLNASGFDSFVYPAAKAGAFVATSPFDALSEIVAATPADDHDAARNAGDRVRDHVHDPEATYKHPYKHAIKFNELPIRPDPFDAVVQDHHQHLKFGFLDLAFL
jgi:hypothetical protein